MCYECFFKSQCVAQMQKNRFCWFPKFSTRMSHIFLQWTQKEDLWHHDVNVWVGSMSILHKLLIIMFWYFFMPHSIRVLFTGFCRFWYSLRRNHIIYDTLTMYLITAHVGKRNNTRAWWIYLVNFHLISSILICVHLLWAVVRAICPIALIFFHLA